MEAERSHILSLPRSPPVAVSASAMVAMAVLGPDLDSRERSTLNAVLTATWNAMNTPIFFPELVIIFYKSFIKIYFQKTQFKIYEKF